MAHRNVKFKKIRVRNFLAHKDTTIHLDETGAYHLWGENNSGKSALLNAIAILMRNISNLQYKAFLRDDTDTFRIDAEMWDGSEITLSRGSLDFYEWTIDGNYGRLDKTKGNVPTVLSDYFNLYVDSEKAKHWVNLRLVRETLLFVDTTAGEQALLLQKALGTEDILMAMKIGDKEKKQLSSKVKFLNEQLDTEKPELDKIIAKFKNENNILEDLERKYDVINKDYTMYQEMKRTLNEAVKLIRIKNEIKQFESLNNVEKFEQIQDMYQKYGALEKTLTNLEKIEEINSEIELEKSKTLPIEKMSEIKSLVNVTSEMEHTIKILETIENEKNQLKQLEISVHSLEELLIKIDTEIKVISRLEDVIEEKGKLETTKSSLDNAIAEYSQADSEWLTYMQENSFCPIVAQTKDKTCPFGINKGA